MGLHTGTPTVSPPVRQRNNRPGSSQSDTAGRETSLSSALSAVLSCGSRLLRVPPACREYPKAKDPVECQAKKKLQLSIHRLPSSDLFFLKLFHGMQVTPPPRKDAVSVWIRLLLSFMCVSGAFSHISDM